MNSIIIEPIRTPGGLANLKIRCGGQAITLHSSEPFREAERIVSKFNQNLPWVLIAGMGLGYTAEYILNNTLYRVIIYEPDSPIFEYAVVEERVKKLLSDKRVNLIIEDIDKIMEFLENNSIRELNFYINRSYLSLFPRTFPTLDGRIAAYLSRKQINKSTLKRFQKIWIKNILKNSSFFFRLPGITDIKNDFEKKPAVIAGAGPSLSLNMDRLEKYQDRLIIISTDTAYMSLVSHGISPDFIVSVDPQDKNSLYLLYAFKNDPFLVIDSAASTQSFIKYDPEKIILYDSIFPLYNELKHFWGKKGSLMCGGSVSTTAFDLARYLKCDPIIFIGQDLSYPLKHTHIKGSILEEFLYHKTNRFHTFEGYNSGTLLLSDRIEIEGWYGKRVHTDRKFLTFLDWFSNEIRNTAARVINSTEGGAVIKGAEHMPLGDVLQSLDLNKPSDKNIRCDRPSAGYDEKGFIDLLKNIAGVIKNILVYSERAYSAAKAGMNKYKNNINTESERRIMSEFDIIFSKCLSENTVLARMVEFTMQESIDLVSQSEGAPSDELFGIWLTFYREAWEGLSYLSRLIDKRLKS